MPTLETLEKWKTAAVIASSVAIPIVLAIVGYFVQQSLADEGLKKDYVQIAVGVLSQKPEAENKEIRAWAIALLEKNSPVPFNQNARDALARTPLSLRAMVGLPPPIDCSRLDAKSASSEKLSKEEALELSYCMAWGVVPTKKR